MMISNNRLDEFRNFLMGTCEFKSLDERFDKIVNCLMNHLYLSVGRQSYRIIELEIYYHDPKRHPDPYVHRAEEQLTAGKWYYNGMGVDITFGDKENMIYGGILLRGIRTIGDKPKYISGTINVLREIFTNLGEITDCDHGFCIKEATNEFVDNIQPQRSVRIGLTKKNEDDANYFEKKYRYIAEFKKEHKFKDKERVIRQLFEEDVIDTKEIAKEIMDYNIGL